MAKVLVVEDVEEIREMIRRQMQRRGHTVAEAVDGQDAIDKVRTDRPDVILMDLNLPVLDGWEATKRLKADPATRSIPIIALTAHATSGDRDAEYAAGADAFESKPIDFDRLAQRIDKLLG